MTECQSHHLHIKIVINYRTEICIYQDGEFPLKDQLYKREHQTTGQSKAKITVWVCIFISSFDYYLQNSWLVFTHNTIKFPFEPYKNSGNQNIKKRWSWYEEYPSTRHWLNQFHVFIITYSKAELWNSLCRSVYYDGMTHPQGVSKVNLASPFPLEMVQYMLLAVHHGLSTHMESLESTQEKVHFYSKRNVRKSLNNRDHCYGVGPSYQATSTLTLFM